MSKLVDKLKDAEQKSEARANKRAEAESAAANALRAGIAAKEALDQQVGKTAEAVQRAGTLKPRPRRWSFALAGVAIIAAIAAAYVLVGKRETRPVETAPAEPLELRLDYRLTSARTPGLKARTP